jgi:hypothetical protein
VRRLRDFQIVLLQAAEIRVPCCAIATAADECVLEPRSQRDVAHRELPMRCELIFEADHHPVMLFGMVDEGPIPGTLRFQVTDDVTMHALRLHPRLISAFDALIVGLDEYDRPVRGPVVRTTRDIGAGGVFLAGHVATPGTRMGVRVAVPGLPRQIECTGRVLRCCTAGAAVRFEDLDPGLEHVFERLIFTLRRRVARRALDADLSIWRDVA